MKKNMTLRLCAAFLSVAALSANAAVIEVLPSASDWGTGDANSAITNTVAKDGNGSLELNGDRTRFFGLGNPYNNASNIGLLSDLTNFTFDWLIAGTSISNLSPDYTPALRLHLWNADGSVRSELIWEGAYNGTYGNTDRDVWYSTSFSDNFYLGGAATPDYNVSLGDQITQLAMGTYISAISVGVGSSAGNGYKAFADNVTIGFAGQESRTFNFETDSVAVSTPASLGLFSLGLLMLSTRLRKMKAA
ncbi:hypothetical protein [Brumicola nitratireducens]|uniref:PEP-CTERM sorting domain-containing protein n=1 Tax=Glaciecola nitratireducens (strain JCM 12485 / KCTC 12276 / FR1064) TaxID=1085623 RepID=G4QKI0_GLANF|nr:hypothetical protein [Glaciecola nitratireducens]AEP30046.1 hypothetical protein GNIT_1937 [Glaciecola nitratireducens FR1064]